MMIDDSIVNRLMIHESNEISPRFGGFYQGSFVLKLLNNSISVRIEYT